MTTSGLHTCRTVITAHLPQYDPYGDTPPTDFFGSLDTDVSHARVLLLGSDPWHILASLAAAGARPHLHAVDVAFVDKEPVAVARAALLLLLASELDPQSDSETSFLWHVWNNELWPEGAWDRLKPYITRLRDSSLTWLQLGSLQGAASVVNVWDSWLQILQRIHLAKINPHTLAARRNAWLKDQEAYYPLACSRYQSDEDKYRAWAFQCAAEAVGVAEVYDSSSLEDNTREVLWQSFLPWVTEGCLWPEGPPKDCPGPDNVNVTLWDAHGDCHLPFSARTPMSRWAPVPLEQLMQQNQLATAWANIGVRKMKDLVTSLQKHTSFAATTATATARRQASKVGLRVFLHCMDPLQFCCEAVAALGGEGRSGVGAATVFHVIETGSLCDRVGLLPLLVSATPRLAQTRASRIRTEVRAWGFVTDNVKDYMCKYALGLPIQLFPTMLGLRLVTDIEHGSQGYFRCSDTQYNERTRPWLLEWAPAAAVAETPQAPLKPTLTIPVTSKWDNKVVAWHQDCLLMALCTVAKLCCRNDFSNPPYTDKRAPLSMPTPGTLALLLPQLVTRVVLKQEGKVLTGVGAVEALTEVCGLFLPGGVFFSQCRAAAVAVMNAMEEVQAQAGGRQSGAAKVAKAVGQLGALTLAQLSQKLMRAPNLVRLSFRLPVTSAWQQALPQHAAAVRVVALASHLVFESRGKGRDVLVPQLAEVSGWQERALRWLVSGELTPPGCLVLDAADITLDNLGRPCSLTLDLTLACSDIQDLKGTCLVLLDLRSCTFITHPLLLTPQLTPAATVLPPVPALCHCLRVQGLLDTPTTPQGAGSSTPSNRKGATGKGAAPSVPAAARGALPLMSTDGDATLEVVELLEGLDLYSVEFSLTSKTRDLAKERITFAIRVCQRQPKEERFATASCVVQLACQELPRLGPVTLVLAWPVSDHKQSPYGSCLSPEFKNLSRNNVELRLHKAKVYEQWPLGLPDVQPLVLDKLPKCQEMNVDRLWKGVFSDTRSLYEQHLSEILARVVFSIVRSMALHLDLGIDEHYMFTSEADQRAGKPAFIIYWHGDFLWHPDGRPVLPILALDARVSSGIAAARGVPDPIQQLLRMRHPHQSTSTIIKPAQLDILARYLWQNAQRCVPATRDVPPFPGYAVNNPNTTFMLATYLAPVLLEHPSGLSAPDTVTDRLRSLLRSLGHTLTTITPSSKSTTPEVIKTLQGERICHQSMSREPARPLVKCAPTPAPAPPVPQPPPVPEMEVCCMPDIVGLVDWLPDKDLIHQLGVVESQSLMLFAPTLSMAGLGKRDVVSYLATGCMHPASLDGRQRLIAALASAAKVFSKGPLSQCVDVLAGQTCVLKAAQRAVAVGRASVTHAECEATLLRVCAGGCQRYGSGMMKCSGCGAVAYCSRDCQKSHWREQHKKDCAWLKQLHPPELQPEAAPQFRLNSTAAPRLGSGSSHDARSAAWATDRSSGLQRSNPPAGVTGQGAQADRPAMAYGTSSVPAVRQTAPKPRRHRFKHVPVRAAATRTTSLQRQQHVHASGDDAPTPAEPNADGADDDGSKEFVWVVGGNLPSLARVYWTRVVSLEIPKWRKLIRAWGKALLKRNVKPRLAWMGYLSMVCTTLSEAPPLWVLDWRAAALCGKLIADDMSKVADFSRPLPQNEKRVQHRVCAAGCGAHGAGVKMCAGCEQVAYCSAACQKDHWKRGHKEQCKTIRYGMAGPPAVRPLLRQMRLTVAPPAQTDKPRGIPVHLDQSQRQSGVKVKSVTQRELTTAGSEPAQVSETLPAKTISQVQARGSTAATPDSATDESSTTAPAGVSQAVPSGDDVRVDGNAADSGSMTAGDKKLAARPPAKPKASPFRLSFDRKPTKPKVPEAAPAKPPPTPPLPTSPADSKPAPAVPPRVVDEHQRGFDLLYQAAMLMGGELAALAEEAKRGFEELAAERL